MLQLPHGIILVTGPTGSGKTSTLYTALNEINDAVRKIITIEDPVEYQLKGVNQIQVSEKAGLTFARGLRSILRHDPDVVLIGEIRDKETAQIAVQASLTGHLVFSTLHTNDAPGALTRLVDMGVEPYLVASSLEAVLAQRLVRVLCKQCSQVDDSPTAEGVQGPGRHSREHHDLPRPSAAANAATPASSDGAPSSNGWTRSNEIRQMVLRSASSDEIRDAARRDGMRTLADDGWRLVRLGDTTVEEVLSVTTAKEVSLTTVNAGKRTRRIPLGSLAVAVGALTRRALMPVFQYKALQGNGAITEGETRSRRPAGGLPANGRPRLAAHQSVRTAQRQSWSRAKRALPRRGRPVQGIQAVVGRRRQDITARVLENFTRLLSSLLAAGVPLSRALVILQKEAANPVAKAKWKEIHDLVVDGMSLADAMAKSPGDLSAGLRGHGGGGRDGRVPGRGAEPDRGFPGAREGDAVQGDDGAALSDDPAVSGDGRADLPDGVLHSAVPDDLRRVRRAQLPLLTQIIVGASESLRSYGLLVARRLGRRRLPDPHLAGVDRRAAAPGRG